MSADDPTSIEYANQQEINRLNKKVEETQKEVHAELEEARAAAEAAADTIKQEQQAREAEDFAVMMEANAPVREALNALQAGDPLQDAYLPPPEDPEPPHPEQLPA